MATLSVVPRPQVLPPEGIAAQYDTQLRRAARAFKSAIMAVAYYGARMRQAEGWLELGFESEDKYRASMDIPRSSWYKAIAIGEALFDLKLADLLDISTGNAELLIQVDPLLRQDHDWVMEARSLPLEDFAQLVSARNRAAGIAEPTAYFRLKVPFSAKAFIEESLDVFMNRHLLSSRAQALEFLIADRHDTPGVLDNLGEGLQLLEQAIFLFGKRKIIEVNEEMYLLKRAEVLIREARTQAVSATREAISREENKERG